VVPHGVDDPGARPAPAGRFTVAFVGRLVEEKGIEDLLAAMRELGGDAQLLVAGDGPLAASVSNAGGGVEYLGPIAHGAVGEVYGRAHVTCAPSRTTPTWEEQFGRVLIESLVRAVPVVATRTGEIPWVLETAGGGTLVEQRDPAGLAAALDGLATHPESAARQGAQGRVGALHSFTNAAAAVALKGLVEGLRV